MMGMVVLDLAGQDLELVTGLLGSTQAMDVLLVATVPVTVVLSMVIVLLEDSKIFSSFLHNLTSFKNAYLDGYSFIVW